MDAPRDGADLGAGRTRRGGQGGQGRCGGLFSPQRGGRGLARRVQWFLTVQQFCSAIVKCLGPLDPAGPAATASETRRASHLRVQLRAGGSGAPGRSGRSLETRVRAPPARPARSSARCVRRPGRGPHAARRWSDSGVPNAGYLPSPHQHNPGASPARRRHRRPPAPGGPHEGPTLPHTPPNFQPGPGGERTHPSQCACWG